MNIRYDIVLPVLFAFVVNSLFCPILIPFLRKLKFGQYIRQEGPQSHRKKSGTPTMGGVAILVSVGLVSAVYMKRFPLVIPVMFVTLGFGLIGLLDDYIKIVMHRSMGLSALQKLLGQLIVTLVFTYYMVKYGGDTLILVPFARGIQLDCGRLYIPFLIIVILGTVNGANFTDGLDGLATSVTLLIATFFSVVAIGARTGLEPITSAVAGALLGFLLYNVYPAQVFMGDTGSLALGGFVAATAIVLKLPLFIPIVAMIYMLEVLSVILQVTCYKITGKRILKMAPMHHHFELCGWPETKVVTVFTIITTLLCVIALLGL